MPSPMASRRCELPQLGTFIRVMGECVSCHSPSGSYEQCVPCSARTLENAGRFLARRVLCEACGVNRGYWSVCEVCFAQAARKRHVGRRERSGAHHG